MTRALSFIVSAMLAAACASQGNVVEYEASVNASAPEMVTIAPDVDVLVDTREPVFRTSNAYWLYRDDGWYRSDDLRGNWVRIVTPPRALQSITEPRLYANYRPDARTVYPRDLTTQRDLRGPATREPQAPRPQAPQPQAPYPRPPQQEPPALPDGPGTTNQVPRDPTMPSQPGTSTPQNPSTNPPPREPDDLNRPDRMRDR